MSVRAENPGVPTTDMATAIAEAQPDGSALAEGASFSVATPENPLTRNIVVSVRASLNDLCLQKSRGTWAPSSEALRSIFQQRKFTSLDGAAENKGDLKSIVLHSMKLTHIKSSFPMSLGAFTCPILFQFG